MVTKRAPCSTSRRASRVLWPRTFRPYASRTSAGSRRVHDHRAEAGLVLARVAEREEWPDRLVAGQHPDVRTLVLTAAVGDAAQGGEAVGALRDPGELLADFQPRELRLDRAELAA